MSRLGAKQRRGSLVLALAVLVLAGAGCGGGEPSYCSSVNELEASVQSLGDVEIVAGGTNAVRDAVAEVEAGAKSTVNAAKSDFPDETSAVRESISNLKASAQRLAGGPTAEEAGGVAVDVKAVVASVNDLGDATSAECD